MFSLFKKKEKPVFISEYRKQEILKYIESVYKDPDKPVPEKSAAAPQSPRS